MSSSLLGQAAQQSALAVVQSADANKTLTIDDSRHQVFTGLTASRDCTLPTTGVLAGEVWLIENTTAFDLVVKSSNGTALTIANGANSDATTRGGFVRLRATQATPTTPAHWRVVEGYDTGTYSDTATGALTTAAAVIWHRRMNTVNISASVVGGTASAANGITIPGTNSPARIRAPNRYATAHVGSGGTGAAGIATVQTNGNILFNKYDSSNFSGSSSVGGGGATEYSHFAYNLP